MVIRTAPPPRQFPGPFVRWPRTADAVLALAVFLAMVFVMEGPRETLILRPLGDIPIAAPPLFGAAAGALYWRRRAPMAVVGVTVAAWAATLSGVVDKDMTGLATLIALYSAGRHSTDDRKAKAGIVAAVLVANIEGLVDPAPWQDAVVYATLFMFGSWYVGRRLRLRRERAAELLREQATEARRIVADERTRIARELHDVVAHRVSLMTVQAGAAKAVATQDLDAALRAMGAVEEAGRQALDELRHLLGVLRPEAGLDGLGPQPGLADLPRLVEQIGTAGVTVTLSRNGAPAEPPARVDLFAYRIIQEALTNVLKHAGPGAGAEVRIGADGNGIVIEVHDDGQGTTAMSAPGVAQGGTQGHGIVGMRERALLLGGSLDAGPRPGGGFGIVAHLPTGGEPA
jgi:signal transduction histidine kinase